VAQDGEGGLWDAVDAALEKAGLYQATATVFDAPSAKLRSLSVLVNHPNQDWATRLYRDVDVEAPPTAGFHIDSDGKCFTKIVLYLTDVGADQGPFGVVPGSHRWGEGSRDRIFRSAFDRSPLVVRSAKLRRRFLSLPAEMQTKAEFGGDMIPGSPEAEALLQDEKVMTGPRGQLNLFNPDAIHRGGNVGTGERHVLLISIGPRWNRS
jgi:ectoine hydroxylase-related dioxygenase (phytanoyl-CoA dioxygenase family)